ncbi:MAG TPA: tryptophan-rich sensory protein [Candidatus Omnitrophota bacterium]|nr:tryptophan-rich sensory protein [Candidatus Omnitrophota bacterium]HPS36253.1 tryptophan-rich sensory protein [Candidatus Omnitrophota bacterium]
MKLTHLMKFLFALVLCQGAGMVGAVYTIPAIPGWYAQLQKPFFSPPNWIFGPVWTLLFTLMAIAAYLVWSKGLGEPAVRKALVSFLLQLALNSLWCFLFFGLRSPLYGLAEILLLWAMILVTILQFFRISRPAGWLLIPYLLWVSFATSLNLGIFILNR